MVSPGPPLIKMVIEEAEVPRLENASYADDESVGVKENLHLAFLTLEDHALERKRGHSYVVSLHIRRSRKGLLPQI